MNPSCFRINVPQVLGNAIKRLCDWLDKRPKDTIDTIISNAVSVSCDGGVWKGGAVYVYHNSDWTVFEDLAGYFFDISPEEWLKYAGDNSLVVAGYNDAIISAKLSVIENQLIVRDFFELDDAPNEYRNIENLPFEDENPIQGWSEVASFVDDDRLCFSELCKCLKR